MSAPHVVSPELFRERFEAEALRHNRYLEPVGLLRLGPRERHTEKTALAEAFRMEIRQTDSACALPDGSWALLALHAGERQLRVIARRLMDACGEIERERGDDPSDLIGALCGIRDTRIEAALVWLSLGHSFESCRAGSETIICVR
jgi:hypothetical protein